jgi:hypothetical protein
MTKRSPSFDLDCSSACARAAFTLLLFSAMAVGLTDLHGRVIGFRSAIYYSELRMLLAEELKRLDQNDCWRNALNDPTMQTNARSWSLKRLSDYECRSSETVDRHPSNLSKPRHDPLGALYFARIVDLLHHAARYVATWPMDEPIANSIKRWELRAAELLDPVCEKGSYVVIDCAADLSLSNVRELDELEKPDQERLSRLVDRLDQITVPSVPLPVSLDVATHLTLLGAVTALVYFWLWLREARQSETFPTPGTFLGTLGITPASRRLFLLFLCFAASATAILCWRSIQTAPAVNADLQGINFVLGRATPSFPSWFLRSGVWDVALTFAFVGFSASTAHLWIARLPRDSPMS